MLCAVAGVLQLGLVLAAGGDWMHFYRFIVPVYPLLAAGGVAGLIRVRARAIALVGAGRLGRPAVDLVLGVALAAVVGYGLLSEVRTRRLVMPYVESGGYLTDAYRRAGEWLAADSAPGAKVAASDIGALGYFSRRPIIDMFGLTDAHISRMSGRRHFKNDPDYVLDRDPAYVVLIRDANGGYLRVPDQAMAANARFQRDFTLVHTVAIPFRGETVEIYARRTPGGNQ